MSLWEWLCIGKAMAKMAEVDRQIAELRAKEEIALSKAAEKSNKWVEAILAWRGIGQEFEYLGRKMVLTSIYRERVHTYGKCINVIKDPHIEARYADNSGVIQTLALTLAEVQALAAASAEKAAAQP